MVVNIVTAMALSYMVSCTKRPRLDQCSASRLHAVILTEEYNAFFGASSVVRTGYGTLSNNIVLFFQDDKTSVKLLMYVLHDFVHMRSAGTKYCVC